MYKLRNNIDKIDNKLVLLLSERMKIVRRIAVYKSKNKIPILDKKREQKVLSEKKKLAKKYKLDENYIRSIFKLIMKQSKKEQKKIY